MKTFPDFPTHGRGAQAGTTCISYLWRERFLIITISKICFLLLSFSDSSLKIIRYCFLFSPLGDSFWLTLFLLLWVLFVCFMDSDKTYGLETKLVFFEEDQFIHFSQSANMNIQYLPCTAIIYARLYVYLK